jgi:hypothetical protein
VTPSAEEQAPKIELPPQSAVLHRAIAQKAAENLGRMCDGNGLKADQVKLTRADTAIERIGGYVSIKLATQTQRSQGKGRAAQGMAVESAADVAAIAEGQISNMLRDGGFHEQMRALLQKDPGEGFGMDSVVLPLPGQRKDFSVTSPCPTCAGNTLVNCHACGGRGNSPCPTCRGNGFSNCIGCQGLGRVLDPSGTYIPCMRCQGTGKNFCATCRGQRTIACSTCRGQCRIGCLDCGQTGFLTEIYKVNYTAECSFDVDWRETSSEGRAIGHKIGLRALATEKHIEIIWQEPKALAGEIRLPCTAFLPIAKAEFSIEGRAWPAVVAGLQGRIIDIEPVLDDYLKPGINALMNLSKGPLARQALIDTACKYRLIRQTLTGLARFSQKNVYQRLNKSYPLMLSDKYARATVKYAASAVATLSARPRYEGLAAGTVIAALLTAVYFMMPLRHLLVVYIPPLFMLAPDVIVWLAGWGITVYTIKRLTARGLQKLLPGSLQIGKGALPSAGPQGWMGLLTTGVVWLLIAFCAAEKPGWILHFFK